ncbi:MAG: NADH-quinone oxidoreductase subunit C [Desulfobacteraceae bacterium]|nr:MAG: NADH-quinone oxidoreductase subunit C [Desulfobacteraceae bacterium]
MKKQLINRSVPEVLPGCKDRGNVVSDYAKTGFYAGMFIEKAHLLNFAAILFEKGYFLEDISGVDVQEGILVVYHFDRYDRSERLTVRVLVSHDAPSVPSIVSVFSGADWHERECFDFFGVVFENHPNLKPLLLPDDLGVHPLLKEKNRQSLYAMLPFDQLVDCNSS